MKKVLLSAAFVLAISVTTFAQSTPKNAIGLRFGGNSGLGTEITYQRKLAKNNRLELDLGWRTRHDVDAFKVTGIYQWMWNIDQGFNWYAGAGAAVGTWNYSENIRGKRYSDNGTFGLVTGTIGVEYNFDFPLQISLDLRPEIYLNDSYRNGLYTDLGLAVRYRF
ncbi:MULTISPECIES: hypothetical protein [Myroides]|uniref:Outer membrane protein beta-barrel domain-containing protein n=1 Tax=Myroides albus TaxID=2562892 RepID=A0A6I3LN09_9FLAO|nr:MULTISPECIES: hypothetical protein [Myroides]MTG98876.1 hypothetical protein [Myroides albus]MVX37109.1 hypothetical protein [Myroides sp. LoEW2-1]UVD79565.1 hypothetical protein NWE55_15795 [Myroides albus]